MKNDVWESEYFETYDQILLNSDIYLAVRDFHINSMRNCFRVLDSGCGTGNVTLELLKKGQTVYAIDNSKKALDVLRKKCREYRQRLHILNVDAKNLPFENAMFDGVSSMFVVYYIDDPEAYLRESYRVLRTGGTLALTARVSSENMERVLKSYEKSLKEKGLLPKLKSEFLVFSEKFLSSVAKAVVSGYTFEEMENILGDIGFTNIKERPNPYFGQCYSLIGHKGRATRRLTSYC